jgi:hypothetical protein
MAIRLGTGQSGDHFPACKKDISLFKDAETGSGQHPTCYSMGNEVKLAAREANHSPPSRTEVKDEWN